MSVPEVQKTKVVIVGAGLAGLALARMLEMLNIPYLLLEGYLTIAPPVGASLGLQPGALRIMDQIGAFEGLQKYIGPFDRWEHRNGDDGSAFTVTSAFQSISQL